MSQIKIDKLQIPGYTNIEESPLAILRDKKEHLDVKYDEKVPKDIGDGFGKFSGFRVLPYKMQSHYKRSSEIVELKTIIYENEILRAVFLPEYGGRLYSLYNKKMGKELLTVNPVFQPANLANRRAWFSGGIEWNVGHYGHSFLTCEPVFFAVCENASGEQFIRMYEHERVKKVFYQIDFYLPKDADHLISYVKIFNPYDEDTSIYYWSNTAVSELNKARVFSATNDVVYIKPYVGDKGQVINVMSYGQLPELEGVDGDVSYPRNFKWSNEYFFQNSKEIKYPWEAVGYEDGSLFYECSNRPLTFRKMFCWGTHRGGTKWQEYLSHDCDDRYVEVQAGIFPTQLHSGNFPANSVIEFMQIFGLKHMENTEEIYANYNTATKSVHDTIFTENWINKIGEYEKTANEMSKLPIVNVISYGKGWGALEILRAKKEKQSIALDTMSFPTESLDAEQKYWMDLLNAGEAEDTETADGLSVTYMIDKSWIKYLDSAIETEEDGSRLERHILNKAIILNENFADVEAVELMKAYLTKDSSAVYLRTLGAMLIKTEKTGEALDCYNEAYEKLSDIQIKFFEEDFVAEYMDVLILADKYQDVWEIYQKRKLQNKPVTEEMNLCIGQAAAELGHWGTIDEIIENSNSEHIREGNNILVELWFRKQVNDRGNISIEEARRTLTPPSHIDFRML